MRWMYPLSLLVLLAACAGPDHRIGRVTIEHHIRMPPSPEGFIYCYDHGCQSSMEVRLTPSEWAPVEAAFDPVPETAEQERAAIRKAVAHLEQVTGRRAGTSADKAGTYANMFASRQLDCADETHNTHTYLVAMREAGLIRLHNIGGRVWKGRIVDALPHMAVTVTDKESGAVYVVDSWYRDNGEEPYTVTLAAWRTPYEDWGDTGEPNAW